MTLHPRSRHLSRIPFSAMATAVLASVLLLQSCKRAELGASWIPASASPSAYLEDSVLTSRVKAALLLSPVSHSINIGVESHQGVVLLSGMVANQTQLDLAMFVAQNVPGVDKVDSFLFFVKTPPTIVSRTHHLTGAVSDTPAASALLQRQRVVDGAAAAPATSGQPQAVADDASADTGPLQTAERSSSIRRWVRLSYGVLGISSIHDELQIKP